MGKVVKSILGGIGFGSAPKAPAPTPIAVAPIDETKDEAKKAKAARAALYATEGGASGSELDPTQVSKRPTLLGN